MGDQSPVFHFSEDLRVNKRPRVRGLLFFPAVYEFAS